MADPEIAPALSSFEALQTTMRDLFSSVMEANDLDALAYPQTHWEVPDLISGDVILSTTVADINLMGTPAITVPAGYYEDGSPFGLIFLGEEFTEAQLLGYAYDFEQATQHRAVPELFLLGDFDEDGQFAINDANSLTREIPIPAEQVNFLFDVNRDRQLSSADITMWVEQITNAYIGDAKLDGEFNTADLTAVFQAGEYRDDVVGNSTWASGDWNGDAEFDTGDLIFAFQSNGFEQGLRAVAVNVPEPSSLAMLLTLLLCVSARGRTMR